MFYLTIYSSHFIYDYIALDMVYHHSDSERGNLLLQLHGFFFQLAARDCLYAQSQTAHTISLALDGTRNSSMGPL